MYLAGRLHVSEIHAGHDRDRVLSVGDVRHVSAERRVDVICECVVAHARHAVADHAHARVRWQVQREVDRIKERKCRAKGVARHENGCRAVLVDKGEYRREDRRGRPLIIVRICMGQDRERKVSSPTPSHEKSTKFRLLTLHVHSRIPGAPGSKVIN